MSRPAKAQDEPVVLWAVYEFSECDYPHLVVAYTTRQTAKQDVDRRGGGFYVGRIDVQTKMREW